MNSCLPENLIKTHTRINILFVYVQKFSAIPKKNRTRLGYSTPSISIVLTFFCSVSCCFFSLSLSLCSYTISHVTNHRNEITTKDYCLKIRAIALFDDMVIFSVLFCFCVCLYECDFFSGGELKLINVLELHTFQ